MYLRGACCVRVSDEMKSLSKRGKCVSDCWELELTGGDHGLQDDGNVTRVCAWQVVVVNDRHKAVALSVHSQVVGLRERDELEHSVTHAEPGSKDRHQSHLGVELFALGGGRVGRLDVNILELQIAGGLVPGKRETERERQRQRERERETTDGRVSRR